MAHGATVSVMRSREVDVTQPSPRARVFQFILVLTAAVLSPIGMLLVVIATARVASEGRNPGGGILFAVLLLVVMVFAIAWLWRRKVSS